jgi:TolB-like protein
MFILVLAISFPLLASQNVEQKIQALCDSLVRQFPDSIATPRLAVLPFTDITGKSQGQGVAEYVVSCLQKSKRFLLVDRMEFQKAITEIELGNSDVVDSASALKVGKILSAPYLLTGTISNVFGACKISAKIIRAETTELMAAASVAVAPSELDRLTKELLGERTQVSATLFRSMVVPGWGQFYSGHYVRGSISLVAFVGAGIATAVSFVKANNVYQDYRSYEDYRNTAPFYDGLREDSAITHKTWAQELLADTLKSQQNWNRYSKAYDQAIMVTAITAGVYALNLIDAIIAGIQEKKKFRPYFSASADMKSVEMGVAWKF